MRLPRRVAILNLGPPPEWRGGPERAWDVLGTHMTARTWRDAAKMLSIEGVDVVVVRVNSRSGYLGEDPRLRRVFQDFFMPRFRMVAWVDEAIGPSCMSAWTLPEWCFTPEGRAGDCLKSPEPDGSMLLEWMTEMEEVSARGRHPWEVMRSMMLGEPLSCDIGLDGRARWFQNRKGRRAINAGGAPLVLGARDALELGVARGIAGTREELVRALGLGDVEWAGESAAAFINDGMKRGEQARRLWEEERPKYLAARDAARALPGAEARRMRRVELGLAREHLAKLEGAIGVTEWLDGGRGTSWLREERDELERLEGDGAAPEK